MRQTLRAYVRRRTGVPLGHRSSLRNMLRRSFGAPTLGGFWRYWNPIWSYGLSRFVHAPLRRIAGPAPALLGTFAVSGLLHDAVIMALRGQPALLFTPWFLLVGVGILAADARGIGFSGLTFGVRALLHTAFLTITFLTTTWTVRALGLW